jgi:large subunit ribosomal protein L18
MKNKFRLLIHRTNNHFYAQILDVTGCSVVASASSLPCLKKGASALGSGRGDNKSAAAEVGRLIAEKAKSVGVSSVVFDRSGFLYHGRVKVFAESARENGLVF